MDGRVGERVSLQEAQSLCGLPGEVHFEGALLLSGEGSGSDWFDSELNCF